MFVDIEFAVKGELSLMARRAEVVGPFDRDRAEHTHHGLGPPTAVTGATAAATGWLRRGVGGRLQQLLEQLRAGSVQCRTGGRLQRFQVPVLLLAPGGEDQSQQLFDFLGDFLLDRRGRFFSCGVTDAADSDSCSTGRKRQIFSLTSMSSRLSCWKRRKAVISR